MTVKETILSYPGLSDISEDYLTKVMVDRAVDDTVDYSPSLKATVALCAADCYAAILASPDFSEGRLSIKMSRGVILQQAISLYEGNGETSKANALRPGKGNASSTFW